MGNERTLAGGRGRWFQFILWVLPTRSSLSNPVGRPTSRSPLPFSSSYACPSLFHQRSPRPFRFSTSSLSDSIVPLVSSRATSRPSFSPPSRKKNFLLSSPPSSLSLSPSLFQHGVFCADTLDESKGFLDRFTRLFFFEENCSFVYIYVCVCVSPENLIGRASFYPEEKLKRSRRYTYSSWHAHLSNGHVHQPLSKC